MRKLASLILIIPLLIMFNLGIAEARPRGCPTAWCGCYLSIHVFGENRRELWLARNWLNFERTSPSIGSVAVFARRGGGHVGKVVGFDENNNPIVHSGNHSGRIATATYSKHRVIAYVNIHSTSKFKIGRTNKRSIINKNVVDNVTENVYIRTPL